MIAFFNQVLSSGFQVLVHNGPVICSVSLLSAIPFGLLVMLVLHRLEITRDLAALLSAGISGGILLDVLSTYPVILLAPPGYAVWLLLIIALAAWILGIVLWRRWRFSPQITPAFYALVILIPLLLVLKLAYISNLRLPLYTDSIQHYMIIQDLALKDPTPNSYYNLMDFPGVFYHYGYHILLAKQVLLTRANPGTLMLVYGQWLLVAAAIGLYFPVILVTRQSFAGWLAVLSGAFLWVMPGYAVNWGKYPAITALAALPLIIGLIWSAGQHGWQQTRVLHYLLLATAVLGCVLIHTRAAVLILFWLAAVALAGRLQLTPRALTRLCIGLAIGLGGAVLFNLAKLGTLLEIYTRFGPAPMLLVFCTSILCSIRYPRVCLAVLLYMGLCMLAAAIQMPPGYERYAALLDRPFFQISFYLPAAILTGVGFAALLQIQFFQHRPMLKYLAGLLLCICLLAAAPWQPLLFPSGCCQLTGDEDLQAYHWLESNSAPGDRVLIAAVAADGALFETDGGAWLEALVGIPTEKSLPGVDFASPVTQDGLCAQGIRWVYAGSSAYSFQPEALETDPWLYRLEYSTPEVRVYRISCKASD